MQLELPSCALAPDSPLFHQEAKAAMASEDTGETSAN